MVYILLVIVTFNLFIISEKVNNIYFKSDNKIISVLIFSLFFVLLYLLSVYCFLFDFKTYYISYFLLSILILPIFFFKNYILFYAGKLKNFIHQNKIITILLLFYFFCILLYPSDEDSLRYHLEIGKKINNGSFYNNVWFDYITLGAHEFIISMGLDINFENISSYTNFTYLLFAIISNLYILKKYSIGSGSLSGLILLSSPYLVALISSQKLYFLPCYIVSYSFAYLFLEKKITSKEIYLILTLNIFCVVIKAIFIPYLIFIFLWCLYRNKSFKYNLILILNTFIISLLLYCPIMFIKYQIYEDPLLPFISINNLNHVWYSEFNLMLRNFNMDFTDEISNIFLKSLLIPVKLIIPLQVGDLFRTLGIGLIFLLTINFKKKKNLYLIFLIFIFSVIVMINFQSRWFLPLLILISIFAQINKFKILQNLLYLQTIILSTILIPFGATIFLTKINIINENFIINRIFQANKIIEHVNKNYTNDKIFTNLNYFYYFDNYIPIYYPRTVIKFDKNFYSKNEKETNLILWVTSNSTNKIIEEKELIFFINQNFICKNISILENFYFYPDRFYLNSLNKKKRKAVLVKTSC